MGKRKHTRVVETTYYMPNPQEVGQVKLPELQKQIITLYSLHNFHHYSKNKLKPYVQKVIKEFHAEFRPG